jgi:phosphoribosylamine--glycine ligase
LCWKIGQSPLVDEVFCAPGNGGMAGDAICINIGADDIQGLARFVKDNGVSLTVVGPEAPLVSGIVDAFNAEGLTIFGPQGKAALLEGSKAFAKEVMHACSIPTARFGLFTAENPAKTFIRDADYPVVVKADGLAAGKGVLVTSTKEEAYAAVDEVMVKKSFGTAGATVVIEERLSGEEASFIAICDGDHILPLASSQDHKAAFDDDRGPNTGGMGAYSPAPVVDRAVHDTVMERVLYPLVKGLKDRGIVYRGIIYAGLMVSRNGPQVLEYNVRMGDPETQPLLMRCSSDIVPALLEVARGGSIRDMKFEWSPGPGVCVVLASGGYPGSYEKGKIISGLDQAEEVEGVKVFHAGTKQQDGSLVTSGGRVLGVTASGDDLKTAIGRAYEAASRISFDGMHYRKDIGRKALERLS